MDKIPAENALMLVGVLPGQKDLEIARLLGWYRIPLRMAPKIVEVDYLAFYQTGAFGVDQRWRICHYAEVKGYELTTRKELIRDEPDHARANEEYYKIQVGPLQTRDKPITAEKWKRVTFLYTTGSLFNRAKVINELVVRSEERAILWKNLRDRAPSSNRYAQEKCSELDFTDDPMMLEFLGSLMGSENDKNDLRDI